MAELLRIGYGKEAVSVYRTDGVSSLFACEVGMTLRGAVFEASYTEGDNTLVVATDSMKNFIQIVALEYGGRLARGLPGAAGPAVPGHVRATWSGSSSPAREVPFARRSEQSFQAVGGDRPSPSSRSTATAPSSTGPAARGSA